MEEVLKQHELYERKAAGGQASSGSEHPHDDQRPATPGQPKGLPKGLPKFPRPPPERQDSHLKYSRAGSGSQSEWGTGEQGYKPPKSTAEKLRKNMPYKVIFPLPLH